MNRADIIVEYVADSLARATSTVQREALAVFNVLGLAKTPYAQLVLSRTRVFRTLRAVRMGWPKAVRSSLNFMLRATAVSLVAAVVSLPLFSAFEAHVINVTATPFQLDPPVLTIPGDIGWNNLVGGTDLEGPQSVAITDPDGDVTHIFYTYTSGTTSPSALADPYCGQPDGPNSGGAANTPGAIAVSFDEDTVIKAVGCKPNGSGGWYQSLTNTKVYYFKKTCEIAPIQWPAGVAVQASGDGVTADDVRIHSNVTVNGSVYSNHDIRSADASGTRTITGDAVASGDILDFSDFAISGVVGTNSAPSVLPTLPLTDIENAAKAGGTVAGSLVFPNSTGGIDLGPSEIMGNLVFGSSNTSTVAGTLYVHGNLVVNSNTTITQDPSMADQLTVILVDGTVDVDSNVAFLKAGSSGAFLIISRAAAQSGANAAIETSSNNSDLGDAVLFATQGDVHIRSNRTLLAAFASHGTGADNPAIRIRSNVTFNYRQLPGQIGCGAPFSRTDLVVINEFMPDPAGSDQGTAGGPLDGEWVELYNGMDTSVDVAGWVLYDGHPSNTHALPITPANVFNPATTATSTVIAPHGRLVVYRDGDADFSLGDSSDTVRLFNGAYGAVGVSLVDSRSYSYPGGGGAPENKSFTRMPDGTSNWVDPEPTPGEPNEEFVSWDTSPTPAVVFTEEGDEQSAEEMALADAPEAATTTPTTTPGEVLGTSTPATATPALEEVYSPYSGGGGSVTIPDAQTPEEVLGTTTPTSTPEQPLEPVPTTTPETTGPEASGEPAPQPADLTSAEQPAPSPEPSPTPSPEAVPSTEPVAPAEPPPAEEPTPASEPAPPPAQEAPPAPAPEPAPAPAE